MLVMSRSDDKKTEFAMFVLGSLSYCKSDFESILVMCCYAWFAFASSLLVSVFVNLLIRSWRMTFDEEESEEEDMKIHTFNAVITLPKVGSRTSRKRIEFLVEELLAKD